MVIHEDEAQFCTVRRQLLAQPSVQELQTMHRIDYVDEHADNPTTTTTTTAQPLPTKKPQSQNTLFIHYTHEKRLDSFKRDMHTIYADVFQGSPAMEVKLVVGHRNSHNTQLELARKRPDSALLKPRPLPGRMHVRLCDNDACLLHRSIFIIVPARPLVPPMINVTL